MTGNKPITQYEVELKIMELMEELEECTSVFQDLAIDHAKKDAKAKKSWASAYIKRTGSIKEREAWADYEANDSEYEAQIAEALMKSCQQKMSALRTSMDALRTIAANVRTLTS